MTKFNSLFAAILAAASLNAVAADWSMVSSSAEEQVFVDSQSIIKDTDNLMQVRVLENFAETTVMGHGFYEHKSRFILLAVDCEAGAVSYQQWSLHADALCGRAPPRPPRGWRPAACKAVRPSSALTPEPATNASWQRSATPRSRCKTEVGFKIWHSPQRARRPPRKHK